MKAVGWWNGNHRIWTGACSRWLLDTGSPPLLLETMTLLEACHHGSSESKGRRDSISGPPISGIIYASPSELATRKLLLSR